VRAVVHLALPKSVEQFYQEAGRAGRDGNPADCILLWRKQDAGLLGYFANQVLDTAERERAWQRYHTIRAFAESRKCRHRQICTHFGETPKWASCGSCDVCGAAPVWLTGTVTPAMRRAAVDAVSKEVRAITSTAAQVDQGLREYLREWRRTTAKKQGVPAFVVLHDSSLDEICRLQPTSISGLLTITGIGERKADLYGQDILSALRQYREGARAAAPPEKQTAPALETLQLLAEGKSLEDIARIRGRQIGTVVNAVAALVEKGEVEFRPEWIDRNRLAVIEAACASLDLKRLEGLKTLKDALPPEITYDEIRLVIAKMRREGSKKRAAISA
jgi:ATP-dependent DNA helicase RecQ